MMLPHEREMVKRLKDQPFTLLGINSDESQLALKKAMKEQKITWPQIYGGPTPKNKIAQTWNVHLWPTLFVVDHEGIIRYRDLHDLDEKVVDELIAKVPGADTRPAIQKPAAKDQGSDETPEKGPGK